MSSLVRQNMKLSKNASQSTVMAPRLSTLRQTVTEKQKHSKPTTSILKTYKSQENKNHNSVSARHHKFISRSTNNSSRAKEETKFLTNKENLIGRRTRATSVISSPCKSGNKLKGHSASGNSHSSFSRNVRIVHKKMQKAEDASDSSVIAELQKNKRALEQQVSELVRNAESKKAEIAQLKMQLNRFKERISTTESAVIQEEMERLQQENVNLKEHLASLGGSLERTTLSDSEKELILQTAKCNSAPPSIIGISQDLPQACTGFVTSKSDGGGSVPELGESVVGLYPVPVPDWDKQSSSSMSEMSVACLQDRILQMEETHYSTNEELQATLQELTDLQDQLTELQGENERLAEEKAVLLESLCSQTEKLEDCRTQNDTLRQLLIFENSGEGMLSSSEREMRFLELLKSLEEDKEDFANQLQQLQLTVKVSQEEINRKQEELDLLNNRLQQMQATIEALNCDKKLLEKQSAESRDKLDACQLENTQLRTQLDNERIKVKGLQQAREIADRSELDKMLDVARNDKDRAEAQVATLTNKLAVSTVEINKLKEMLGMQNDDLQIAKTNAKQQISELEHCIEQLNLDKEAVNKELQSLQSVVHELEHKCQRHLVDKRELRATISDLKKKLKGADDRVEEKERQVKEIEDIYHYEMKEWKQFQDDLLMTVRVANDFKTEAQQDLERLVLENKQLKDKVASLNLEVEKLKRLTEPVSPPLSVQGRMLRTVSPENPVLSSVEQEIVRQNRNRNDARPLSVKSLIESLESAAKQVKAQNGNVCPSSTNNINVAVREKSTPVLRKVDNFMSPILHPVINETPSALQEHNSNCLANAIKNNSLSDLNAQGKCTIANDRTSLSPKNKMTTETDMGSKTLPSPISILANKLDSVRRNSYGDILDRKDPLSSLVKGGGSKRNALLKWCQNKTIGYKGIDITNFSSSWNDGLAFCALLNTYLPEKINYDELDNKDKRRNFTLAFKAAESAGIPCHLNINEMISMERPDWQAIMAYVTAIYKHFET